MKNKINAIVRHSIVSSKIQYKNITNLLKLPYTQLIDQLISDKNKNKNIAIPKQWILKLSTCHECRYLYQVYKNITNMQTKTKISQINKDWSAVSQNGLQEILNYNTNTNIVKINQYFTYMKQLITNCNANTNIILQLLASGLPYIIATSQLAYKEKQNIKQFYVQVLHNLLNISKQCGLQIEASYKYFPIQLFNIGEQPLVQHIFNKYLYSQLKYTNLQQIQYSIEWLSRFGLPCQTYLYSSLQYIKQHMKNTILHNNDINSKIVQSMYISNILFVILRKIIAYNHTTNNKQIQMIGRLKQIVKQLPITQPILTNTYTIQQVYESVNNSIKNIQERKNNKILQLYQRFNINMAKQNNNNNSINIFTQLHIVRYLLLLLHCEIENKNSVLIIKQLFNNNKIVTYIRNTILFGDMFAQIKYAIDLCQTMHNINLFDNNQINQYIDKLNRQFINTVQNVKAKGISNKNQLNLAMFGRANNMQYLLAGPTQLKFDYVSALNSNSINTLNSDNLQNKIKVCLANDKQLIGAHVGLSLQSIFKSNIEENLHIKVQNVSSSQYPYFPYCTVTNLTKKEQKIYFKTKFIRHSRLPQKHYIIDMANQLDVRQGIVHFANLQ